MNRSLLLFAAASLLAAPAILTAAPPLLKKKKNRPNAVEKAAAVPPNHEAAAPEETPSASNPWHTWTASAENKLEAKFLALENGILTLESKDGRTFRFPVSKLTEPDQKYAGACKALQPRPPLAQDVIAKAAARLDESVNAALAKNKVSPNAATTDSQFVRRIYLDAVGRVPSQSEAEAFLADKKPDKRAVLINQLLNSPGYTMHMFNWFADMLRVKDDYGKGAKSFLYEDWLKDQIAMNRPWDVMVRDMLTADGKLNTNGAAGFLLRDAQMPLDGVSNLLTTFLGADVSCAQCHDHPLAQWTQKDFYGMAAFFGATDGYHEDTFRKIRRLAKSNAIPQANKGLVNQMLTSNAFDLVDLTKNLLSFPADYKYDNAKPGGKVAPALIHWSKQDAAGPAYKIDTTSPPALRDEFAKWMTHPDNPRFATSIANRLWKKVFGIAVQEPVSDLDDPAGAANPELLQHITTYMKQAKFDLREFQRILFNTAAYQRQASPAPEDPKHYWFPGPVLRRMSAEQAWDSILTLAAGTEIDECLLRRGDDLRATALPSDQINAGTVQKMVEDMKAEGKNLRPAALAGGGGKKKGGGKINPRAIAVLYDGGRPQIRSGLLLARASELPQPAPENHFLRLFGQSDRLVSDTNTTDGSVPQMLSLMNGPVQAIITGGSTALAGAVKAAAPAEKIAALYHSFLARDPSPAERDKSVAALNGGLGVADLAWVLLNSREFLFIQ
ncbi:MAG TPA: DUF1549 domain-containing protein [Verrucomicrobiales bacterium]|nr:DUF1549 domain-containing protein [Verrucomicrobiales bacterium]